MKQDFIAFFENSHTYWLSDKKIPSVGSVIGVIFPEFHSEYWLNHKVLTELHGDEYTQHYRSFGVYMPNQDDLFIKFFEKTDQAVLTDYKQQLYEKWERKRLESAFQGTKFHNRMEAEAYQKGYIINPWDKMAYAVSKYPKQYDNQSIVSNLYDLPDGAYPELLVFDLALNVAGQADEVFIQTIGNKRYVDINDHKTNESKPSKSDPYYCLKPFDDRYASKDFKYTVQINTYAYLMMRSGFIVRNLAYTHYKNYDPKTADRIDIENIIPRIELFFEKKN